MNGLVHLLSEPLGPVGWLVWAVAVGLLVLLAVVIVDAYRLSLRPTLRLSSDRRRQEQLAAARQTLEGIAADLWSGDAGKRLAALILVERMARTASEAEGTGNLLTSFVRWRLGRENRSEQFEDVTLALTILGSRTVRATLTDRRSGFDLSGLDFSGAPMGGADLSGFRLAHCVFDGCELGKADLSHADLSGASLAGAGLKGADLTRANLSGANLSGADFTRTDVSHANFDSANVSGALLVEAIGLSQRQLDEAIGDPNTAVPERLRFVPFRTVRTTSSQ